MQELQGGEWEIGKNIEVIKWQEATCRHAAETLNSFSVYKTCRGSTTHIGDSVLRSLAEGIFSPQTLQCSAATPNIAMFRNIFSLLNFLILVQPPHVWSCSPSQSSHLCCWGIGARRETRCLMWGIPNLTYSKWEDHQKIRIIVPCMQLTLQRIGFIPLRQLTLVLFHTGSWHCLTVRAIESGNMECAANTLSGHPQSKRYYWFVDLVFTQSNQIF